MKNSLALLLVFAILFSMVLSGCTINFNGDMNNDIKGNINVNTDEEESEPDEEDPSESEGSTEPEPTDPTTEPDPTEGESVPCVSVKLSHREFTIDNADSSLKLEVVPTPSDTTDKVEFSSSDPNVAKVDGEGYITFVGNGTVDIIVKCGQVTDKCTVTCNVPEANPTRVLELDKSIIRLNAEDVMNPNKIMHTIYSGEIPLTEIVWSSDDNEVAEFRDGVVEIMGEGVTKVHATYGDQEKSCLIVVGTEKGKVDVSEFKAYLIRDGKLVTKIYYYTPEPVYDLATIDLPVNADHAGCDIALVYGGEIFILEWTHPLDDSTLYDLEANHIVVPESNYGLDPYYQYYASFYGNKIKVILRY